MIYKCVECGKPGFLICPDCKIKNNTKKDSIKEVIHKVPDKITTTKYNKDILQVIGDKEPITGLPIYSKYELNSKKNISYRSIQKQVNCFQYKDKYILHSDIIAWFSSYLENNSK